MEHDQGPQWIGLPGSFSALVVLVILGVWALWKWIAGLMG